MKKLFKPKLKQQKTYTRKFRGGNLYSEATVFEFCDRFEAREAVLTACTYSSLERGLKIRVVQCYGLETRLPHKSIYDERG